MNSGSKAKIRRRVKSTDLVNVSKLMPIWAFFPSKKLRK